MQKSSTSKIPKHYKWELLVLLWVAYFLNQGDRQIFGAVLPEIEKATGWSPVQLGLVVTIFNVCYGLCVPIAGFIGDVFRRRSIVFGSLLVFSFGTLMTGSVSGLVLLILYRSIATGVGEAFYYPSANSLIGLYHHRTRATAMAVHQTSVYIGIVVVSVFAAWIATNFSWQTPFYVFGSFGIIWAFVVLFRLRDDHKDAVLLRGENIPKQSATEESKSEEKTPLGNALRHTLSKPTLYFLSLAFGGMVFVNIGFLTWMPSFLVGKFEFSLEWANLSSMLIHHGFAYVGVFMAATFSDYWAQKRKTIRMEVECLGLLLATPFIFLMGYADQPWLVYLALAGFGLFRGVYDSNLFVALFDVIEPKYRSTATGVMLSFAFVTGAFSPVILGGMKQYIGLQQGIMGLSLVYFMASVSIFIALKTCFLKDYHLEKNMEN